MDAGITPEELAAQTGEPVERLNRWRELGILKGAGGDGYRLEDVEGVRLVQLFLRRGIDMDTIARAAEEGGIFERYLKLLYPEGSAEPTYSPAEAAEILGLDLELMRKVRDAIGFAEGERLQGRDLEALRGYKTLLDVGFPATALVEGSRVYVDSLNRVAEMEARLFHIHIHGRLQAQGLSGQQLLDAVDAAGEQARDMTEPMVLFFHRLGWERAIREDAVMHLAEEAGLIPEADASGRFVAAVAFVDLSSFTPLAEAMGDVKAAEVLERFSHVVRESSGRWDGRIVKQIGDAFMLLFPDARSAVACTLEIEERTAAEPQFPAARAGVNWGHLLYREGDWVGSNVNIAARVATEAERHQVLVTAAVRAEAKELAEVEFVRLGKRRLKGLSVQVELFEARRAGAGGREKHIDPVCGMEMDAAEVAARLTLEGTEHCFCSDECLRKYVVAPETYA